MTDELMPWHKNYLVGIEYDRVDLVKEGANSKAHIKLFKSKGGTVMKPEEIIAKLAPEHKTVIEDLIKSKDGAIATAEAAKKVAEDALAKMKNEQAPAAGTSEEEILKTVKDPAVKALLETSIAKTKAAESVAKQLRDEQDLKEAVLKAKEVPNVGADEAKLAAVYKQLKGTDSQLCEDVFSILKSASALIAEGGVFQEIGKKSPGEEQIVGDEAAAWDKIEKKADEISKARNIKKSAAYSTAISENPELYAQYLKAQQG